MVDRAEVQKFGSFNNQVVCSFFEQTVESSFPTTITSGMTIDFVAPNTTLKDEDGNHWNVTRFYDHSHATMLSIGNDKDGRKMYEQVPEVARGYRGMVSNTRNADSHATKSLMSIPGTEPFSYRRWVDRVQWDEGELLSLTGVRAAPALSWYLPSAKGGLMFTSYISKVEGTILGKKCEGFSEFATHWCAPGNSFIDEWAAVGIAWLIVCNEYTDGSRHLCHIGLGRDDLRFALIADEKGPCIATTDVDLKIGLDEGRYPKTLDWQIAGQHWHWEGKPSGDMGNPAMGIERGREGVARLVGDPRQVRLAYGWVNFYADDRIDPYVVTG